MGASDHEDIRFIGVDEVIRIHAYVLDISHAEAQEHIRDVGLLESAILRPQNLYHYQQSAELPALAATLLWGLVNNHPFLDGNKRTGWIVTDAFAHRNGYQLPSGPGAVRLVLGIAMNRRNLDQAEEWIRHNLEPLPRSS